MYRMNVVDARGLECPKPVMKTKEIVEKGCPEISVWVDNEIAASNVTRYLQGQGYTVKREDGDSTILLEAKLEKEPAAEQKKSGAYSILFTSDMIGAESGGLGEVLMKAYLGTLVKKDIPPVVIALMNNGVKMAIRESSALSMLTELADRGTLILVCGTCTKHFGITDLIEVGVISNMFEITEAVFGTPKPIVIG
ncbi:MAG: sulfurtransferase-like selenium metabolism protein YedF [Synergistaceae bacterium]|nr:sulfurtransferase-like selenium metabolism protein YedF [Synergistaceae bacterium]